MHYDKNRIPHKAHNVKNVIGTEKYFNYVKQPACYTHTQSALHIYSSIVTATTSIMGIGKSAKPAAIVPVSLFPNSTRFDKLT